MGLGPAITINGKAYVRTLKQDGGVPDQAWLLADREKGWSAFGYGFKSVEELFRMVPVRVTDIGEDEHGTFIEVSAA